jgi:hypothetical protein
MSWDFRGFYRNSGEFYRSSREFYRNSREFYRNSREFYRSSREIYRKSISVFNNPGGRSLESGAKLGFISDIPNFSVEIFIFFFAA